LTDAEVKELESTPSIDEVIEKLKEKQSAEPVVQQEPSQTPQDGPGHPKAARVASNYLEQIGLLRTIDPIPAETNINVEGIPF
jgi:hypothetical protein